MAEAGPLVLVVEDNPANLRLVQALLARAGYRSVSAGSLAAARAALAEARPDLILLDLGLPDGDGLELLIGAPGIPRVPVLALTAYAMASDQERALAAGCAGYLTKPLDTRGFAATLAEIRAADREGGTPDDPPADRGR